MTTSTPFRDLLHAANLRHATDGFTSPPKEDVLRIFSPLKIERLRPGLNPRTWVLKASTLPPDHRSHYLIQTVHKIQFVRQKLQYVSEVLIFVLCVTDKYNNRNWTERGTTFRSSTDEILRHLLGITKLDKEKNQCVGEKDGNTEHSKGNKTAPQKVAPTRREDWYK